MLLTAMLPHACAQTIPRYFQGKRLKAEGKPNIIFILADDLGYGDLGCYGQSRIRTPILDRLAAEGMRFTQCYAGSTVCAPSRAVLMTGRHTGHARIRGNAKVPLAPGDLTVAEILQQAGYATAAVGKWGLGQENTTGHPNRQGFEDWFGYLDQTHAHDYYPEHLWRNETPYPLPGNARGQKGEYSHDLFTRATGRSSSTSPTPSRTPTTSSAPNRATGWRCPLTSPTGKSPGPNRRRTKRR
jgi:arylsulfatase A-like enzyme